MTAVAKGVFEATASGPVETVRGLPFAPRAVIAWWSQQRNLGIEHGNRGGIGFWTMHGTGAIAWASLDGAERASAMTIAEPIGLLGLDEPGAPPSMRAELTRLESDGFTLSWLERPKTAWIVHYLAIGGDFDAVVGWTSPPRGPKSEGLGVPARDDQVLLFAPTAIPSGAHAAPGLALGIGVAGPGGQAAAAFSVCDGSPPGAVTGAQSTSESIVLAHGSEAISAVGRVGNDASETTIDWSKAEPTAGQVCYLALQGIRATVGTDRSPTTPRRMRTKVGFEPEGLLLFSWGLGPSDVPKRIGRLCIGGASRESSGCAGWDDRNTASSTTGTHVHSSTSNMLIVTDTQTGDIHAAATLRSLDRRGFTLDWTDSDGKEREFAYLALASDYSARRRFRVRGAK